MSTGEDENVWEAIREKMSRLLETETWQAKEQAGQDLPLESQKKFIRKKLERNGTDVHFNDSDRTGDGDQSPITMGDEAGKQVYRDLYATGGDIDAHFEYFARCRHSPTSLFAFYCATGEHEQVKRILSQASSDAEERQGVPSPTLIHLLETRETSMRLSPLLCLVSVGKKMLKGPSPRLLAKDQLEVARLLLKFGARPNAQDVAGKTVCHYGAGAMATPMTMEVVRMCAAAAESSHLFGKQVELRGLKTVEFNGKRGICLGFNAETGRRVVYLVSMKEQMAFKPENIVLVDAAPAPKAKLCDIQDRLGAVALIEVCMTNRVDVAQFLLDDLQASVDIADSDGCSPKSMVLMPGSQMISRVAPLVMKTAMKQARKEKKKATLSCAQCGVADSLEHSLEVCNQCESAMYCSEECQVSHWKQGHKHACKQLRDKRKKSVLLDKPVQDEQCVKIFSSRTGKASSGAYRKPDNVDVDERFYVKVQAGGPQLPLMVYDKSRQCEFSVMPGQPGFQELRDTVKAETATNGTKTFMEASFDSEGNCRIHYGSTSIKPW